MLVSCLGQFIHAHRRHQITRQHKALIMGYPDTFTGYRIESFEKWTDFKKQEV